MHTYKFTYDVNLKPAPGSFCTGPLEIMQQMDDAQKKTLRKLRDFLKAEGLEKDVAAISPLSGEIGIALTCTDDAARKISAQPFVRDMQPYTPPPPKKTPPFPKFKF
jgi:hypothetical protein